MFGISGFELLIIVAFVLIIFGPDKLPELARTLGKATRLFKDAQNEMEKMIRVEMLQKEAQKPLKVDEAPSKAPAETGSDAETAEASAVAAWAVTAEDDEEEEDEE